ncbi:uncharacterized protein LOC100376044 [Saccoglossus kowalevskii]|uniref:Uncharacterized protein LOC100376044 n=1 Tax=Saccoglossus kowalevskii TaxID=10224 RepID=A0ABM0GID7_SACKO|nr:PREDICTED: uncharacterized protein LOC100376044 [Saccoglossus kowalevskii]
MTNDDVLAKKHKCIVYCTTKMSQLKNMGTSDFVYSNHRIDYINTSKHHVTTSQPVQEHQSIWVKLKILLSQLFTDKGNFSLLTTLSILVIGIIIVIPSDGALREAGKFFLSCGIFGFSAGFTNSLAIQMLFIKIPFLYGSGVIPSQYKETKYQIKKLLMDAFASESVLISLADAVQGFSGSTELEKTNAMLDEKLLELDEKYDKWLNTAGLDKPTTKLLLKMLIYECRDEMITNIKLSYPEISKESNIGQLQHMMTDIIESRMEVLTEKKLTDITRHVIKQHLGWVVLWGCFIGGIIGLACQAAGISPNY